MHARLLSFLLLSALSACGSRDATLHQVGWDVFSLSEPPPDQPPPHVSVAAGASNEVRFAAFVDFFRQQMASGNVPGGALAVVLDGRLAYSAGLGVKRAGETAPVTARTRFRAASMSKVVTAIGLLKLQEQKAVELDRPAPELAPWFTRRAGDDVAGVTLRRALSHTAGIPEEGTTSCATGPAFRLRSYFSDRAGAPLWSPPGLLYNYSNGGYAFVGAVIEEASGQRFDDFIRDAVFAPAGMQDATLDVAAARAADHAIGHDAQGTPRPSSDVDDCAFIHPAGGVIASVLDYAHLLEALLAGGGSLLTAESVSTLEAPLVATQARPTQRYGLGLFSLSYAGVRVLAHPGNIPGYAGFFALVPERRFGVVAMVNADGPVANSALAAVDLFLELPPPAPLERRTPPSLWSDYEGIYNDTSGGLGRFAVSLHGDTLKMSLLRGQPGLVPGTLVGTFWRGPDGAVTHFVTRGGVAAREP